MITMNDVHTNASIMLAIVARQNSALGAVVKMSPHGDRADRTRSLKVLRASIVTLAKVVIAVLLVGRYI